MEAFRRSLATAPMLVLWRKSDSEPKFLGQPLFADVRCLCLQLYRPSEIAHLDLRSHIERKSPVSAGTQRTSTAALLPIGPCQVTSDPCRKENVRNSIKHPEDREARAEHERNPQAYRVARDTEAS